MSIYGNFPFASPKYKRHIKIHIHTKIITVTQTQLQSSNKSILRIQCRSSKQPDLNWMSSVRAKFWDCRSYRQLLEYNRTYVISYFFSLIAICSLLLVISWPTTTCTVTFVENVKKKISVSSYHFRQHFLSRNYFFLFSGLQKYANNLLKLKAT